MMEHVQNGGGGDDDDHAFASFFDGGVLYFSSCQISNEVDVKILQHLWGQRPLSLPSPPVAADPVRRLHLFLKILILTDFKIHLLLWGWPPSFHSPPPVTSAIDSVRHHLFSKILTDFKINLLLLHYLYDVLSAYQFQLIEQLKLMIKLRLLVKMLDLIYFSFLYIIFNILYLFL